MDKEKPAEDLIADFGVQFVASFRRQAARRPVRPLDVVDVFADSGEFLFRGVVESVNDAEAIVRANNRPAARYNVSPDCCRHASTGALPRTLADWEAAHRE